MKRAKSLRRWSGGSHVLAGSLLAIPAAFDVSTGVARAQISTDGTLGAARSLAGPSYAIGADLGRQLGGNLFHSFSRFNLATGETAIFSGPNTVANIVGRVTGGAASSIDGTIRSTIPGSNLFLVNPAGLMFGPNARLDVPGSFHATTADYLRFGDGARFLASAAPGSSLSAAPPEAFGFLTTNPAQISIDRSQLVASAGKDLSIVGGAMQISGAFLYAPAGRAHLASAAGTGEIGVDPADEARTSVGGYGPISLSGGAFVDVADDRRGTGSVYVRGGALRLVEGSVIAAETTGALPAGRVSIRAGTLVLLDGSEIDASTFGGGDAGAIDVVGSQIGAGGAGVGLFANARPGASGKGGDISIRLNDKLVLLGGARISGSNLGTGSGAGAVTVNAKEIVIDGSKSAAATGILSDVGSDAAGQAGPVAVSADKLSLLATGEISSSTSGQGKAGSVRVTAGEILLDGGASAGGLVPTGIFAEARTGSQGDAGQVAVDAGTLSIRPHGQVATTSTGTGKAGMVTVTGTGPGSSIFIDGGGLIDGRGRPVVTGIISDAGEGSTGQAGDVSVGANRIVVQAVGQISSSTSGPGSAGKVTVRAGDVRIDGGGSTAAATGIFSQAAPTGAVGGGAGGDVAVTADTLALIGNGTISSSTMGGGKAGNVSVTAGALLIDGQDGAVATGILSQALRGSGDAGDLAVKAGSLTLTRGGAISSSTFDEGRGGNVEVTADQTLLITGAGSGIAALSTGPKEAGSLRIRAGSLIVQEGAITTEATEGGGGNIDIAVRDLLSVNRGRLTTSVRGGTGAGGNMTIDPQFVVLNGGQLQANAFGGPGGNITIAAGQILRTPNSRIEASSQLGLNGTIAIHAGESNVTGSLAELSAKFFDASAVRREGCTGPARVEHGPSSLVAGGRGGLPQDGEGAQPGTYFAGREVRPYSSALVGARVDGQRPPALRIRCSE